MIKFQTENPPPKSNKFSLAYMSAFFAGGNFLSLVLRFIGGIFLVRVTTPEMLGEFNSIGLIVGYVVFLQLGVMNGLNRELPFQIGKGDSVIAHEYASAAQAWMVVIGIIAGFGMVCVSIFQGFQGNWLSAAGWLVFSIDVFVMFFGQNYLQITFRTKGDFTRLAIINVVVNTIALLLVYFVSVFGFLGLCLRLFLTDLTNLALLWKWRPIRVKLKWNLLRLKELLKIGTPIFISGQLYAWWAVLGSTLVLYFLGKSGLGLYQIVLITGSALELLAGSLSQILYPRLAESFGRSGSMGELFQIIKRPILFLVAGMGTTALLGSFLLPYLLKIIAPNYLAATTAAQWNLFSAALMGLQPVTLIFNVIRRQDLYLVALLAGMVVFSLSCLLLGRQTYPLEVFPQAMIIGRIVFFGLCILLLSINYKKIVNQNHA